MSAPTLTRKQIMVSLNYAARCWTASHYVGEECDPEIVRLFGTHVIPTAFTLKADERTVLAEIRRLNPDAIVERG